MDVRQVRLIKRSSSSFLIDGGRNTHIRRHRHSQALDDALKLHSLAPEGVVIAVASSRSHHLGPPVPQYWIGWRKRGRNTKKDGKIHTYVWVIFRLPCCWHSSHFRDSDTHIHTNMQGVESCGEDFTFLTTHDRTDFLHTHTEVSC